jgi:hypothetical protein
MVFPDDSTSGGKKSMKALGHFPIGKFRPRLIVGRIEKDKIERRCNCTWDPIFNRGSKDGEGVVERC